MLQIPLRAEQAELFPRRKQEHDCTTRRGAGREGPGNLQHRHDPRRVVVRPVVDRVTVNGPAHTNVVVMGAHYHRLVGQRLVTSMDNPDHVHVRQPPAGGHRVQVGQGRQEHRPPPPSPPCTASPRGTCHRHSLEKAAVSRRLDPEPLELRRDVGSGHRRARRPRASPIHRIGSQDG